MLAWGTLWAAFLLPGAWGQQATPPRPAQESLQEFRLRIQVDLVATPVTVLDSRGDFVYGLTRSDFTVWDNGVPQQISQFEFSDSPISLAVLLNTSNRVQPLLDRVRQIGILIKSYILGERGEAAVVTFDDEIHVRQEFTSDSEVLEKAIKAIKPGGDRTRLADAIDTAIRLLVPRPPAHRKAILIVSEPRDVGSETPLGEVLRTAQLADITIYTVGLSYSEALWRTKPQDRQPPASPYPPGVFPTPPLPGTPQTPTTEQQNQARADLLALIQVLVSTLRAPIQQDVLEVLAAGTGGAAHGQASDTALQAAINRIGQELHNQYVLAYRPTNLREQGFHEIRVRVRRSDVLVRSRPGYFIGHPE